MTAKVFVDSDILVYAHDADARPKERITAEQIKTLWSGRFGRISVNVILAAAEEQGCSRLLSEDLNPGQVVAGIRIDNPFLQNYEIPAR